MDDIGYLSARDEIARGKTLADSKRLHIGCAFLAKVTRWHVDYLQALESDGTCEVEGVFGVSR